MMKISNVLSKIDDLGKKIDFLHHKIERLTNDCTDLEHQNKRLLEDKEIVNIKIQGYIKELEKIRGHYANSINNGSES